MKTFDNIFEYKTKKRLATYHVKMIERTQMDNEAMNKQLDLETMKITHIEADEKVQNEFLQSKGQCNYPFTREITVEANQEGKWNRLYREIEEISHQYGVDI